MRSLLCRPSPFVVPCLAACLAFCLLWFTTPWVHAEAISQRIAGSPQVPWQISADKVAYDAPATTYRAAGRVVIEKEATRLLADQVAFNHKAMTADAVGHVVLTVGDDLLTGERLELNLEQETGVVHGGSLFLKQNHFYIRGERIEKTGPDAYRVEGGSFTSCDGDRPDWSITSRTLKVTVEGYGSATHAVLRVRNAPVLYTPYLFFPAKTKRQSGLLFPEAGYSDRMGFYWDQPLFWAIGESSDATLYARYMDKRGTKVGLEYRYAQTDASYGTIMADGLHDRQVDDGSAEATDKWGYSGDAYDRTNSDRYWLRAKLDQELPGGAMARLDLDIVSDQDYLTEFKDGLSGFKATRDHFQETFGRDLDTYDENTRTNRLNINRTWTHFSLNADLLWNDNVVKRRWETTDDTLQQLPRIEFAGTKQKILGSAFYWDLASEYTYFYREDGDRGHRADLYPRAYLPLRWKNYLSVEPSAGWRQTSWIMDRRDDQNLDRSTYRQIYDFELDLSTEFSKVMDSPVTSVDRIRHRVKPRVVYAYIPDQDQSDLPDFGTTLDRIAEKNTVTYSLTNTFTARKKTQPPRASQPDAAMDATPAGSRQTDAVESGTFDYSQFGRFYLEQTYDIAAEREDAPEPFSDIYGELDIHIGSYFKFDADADFDPYDNHFSSHNMAAVIADHRGDRLWIEHRYERDESESIHAELAVRLTRRLTVRGEYERDLLADNDILKGAGFLYTAQCWALDFFYSVEDDDHRVAFNLNLMGLGGFGE